jgi:hypothetical protein
MLVNKRAEITINATAEEIWDFLNDKNVWFASNPEEHYATEFFTPEGKITSGATPGGRFRQQESVAGLDADMKGHFLHVDLPKIAVWTGVATYSLAGGLLKLRVPQSGVVKVEKSQEGRGMTLSHEMYMDFPDTLLGKIALWYFKKFRDGENALYQHGQREMVYFKTQIEARKKTSVVANPH